MSWIDPIIHNLLNSTSGSALSIGAIATLWAASLGINGLKNGFNKAYGITPPQNYLRPADLVDVDHVSC
jgi:membrane protein